MTCINALVRKDRVHVMTDGSVWQPDGTITGTTQKIHILAHAHAVIAVRGPTYFPGCIVAFLNGSSLTGFNDLLSKVPAAVQSTIDNGLAYLDSSMLAEARKRADLSRAEVVIAGWSHERRRGEIHMLDTSRDPRRLELWGDGLVMPGENPALIQRLEATGWNLEKKGKDEAALLRLIEHQRAVDDILPSGVRFPTVGGFAQLTTITAEGISTRILRRWPAKAAA